MPVALNTGTTIHKQGMIQLKQREETRFILIDVEQQPFSSHVSDAKLSVVVWSHRADQSTMRGTTTNSKYNAVQIVLLSEEEASNSGGGKLKLLQRLLNKWTGGWRIRVYWAVDDAGSFLLDRQQRLLLINIDVLQMPVRAVLRKGRELKQLLNAITNRRK